MYSVLPTMFIAFLLIQSAFANPIERVYELEDMCTGDIVQECDWHGAGIYKSRLSGQTYEQISFQSFPDSTLDVFQVNGFRVLDIKISLEDGMPPCEHVVGAQGPYKVLTAENLTICVRISCIYACLEPRKVPGMNRYLCCVLPHYIYIFLF